MKIDSSPGITPPATPAATGGARTAASSAAPPASGGALQSAMLQPALEALREMPDIDEARIEALRTALAEGKLPFDAGKLARLIERYHGGHE